MHLLLILGLGLFQSPQPQALTTDALLTYCRPLKKSEWTQEEFMNTQFCTGYVLGVSDAMALTQSLSTKEGKPLQKQTMCMPGNVSAKEMALVFVKYMDEHPEKLHITPEVDVWNALNAAYHCGR